MYNLEKIDIELNIFPVRSFGGKCAIFFLPEHPCSHEFFVCMYIYTLIENFDSVKIICNDFV